MVPHVLTVAGSDPSGGAGIQADLKTFAALGCYGLSVVTALTAQNTRGVAGVQETSPEFVRAQLEAVFEDIRVDAMKIGMIGLPEIVPVVVEAIQQYKPAYVVFDPVMVATSGDVLVNKETIAEMKRCLLPMADIVTPNIPEAEILVDDQISKHDLEGFAKRLLKTEARAVVLKGGHLGGKDSNDIYVDHNQTVVLDAARIETKNTHGTGCTFSAAIAAYLARGLPEAQAAQAAKKYMTSALKHADRLDVGKGAGPVHHFFAHWD